MENSQHNIYLELGQKKVFATAAAGQLPETGPRGGKRWPPRYFIRRSAWHIIDHIWEIEDRID